MKKILILLTFLLSFTIGIAQSAIRSEGCGVVHYKNCDEKYLFESGFDNSNSRTNETKINILNELKKRIENKIFEYSKTTSIDQNLSCAKISQTLWEGKQGKDLVPNFKEDVIILQNFLNNNLETGGSKLVVDGNFDKKLPERIKIFQRIHGISQTGAVGPITLKKINSMICLSGDKIQVKM